MRVNPLLLSELVQIDCSLHLPIFLWVRLPQRLLHLTVGGSSPVGAASISHGHTMSRPPPHKGSQIGTVSEFCDSCLLRCIIVPTQFGTIKDILQVINKVLHPTLVEAYDAR